jgi:hydrogenase expression/formation protein HypD
MKYVDEFRQREAANSLASRIEQIAGERPMSFMEVCGTHTMAAARYGIRNLLPSGIELISGPGCPVCVTANRYLDTAVALARRDDITIVSFGDMFRVPGSSSSLEKEKMRGADVRIVYSPGEAVSLAADNPAQNIVFLGVGFETTAPLVAASLLEARDRSISNFSVLCGHKVVPPALEVLASDPEIGVDGFLCPGHVSAIIGARAYDFLASDHDIPCVVAGFEPTDILEGVLMLVQQVADGRSEVEIQYRRVVDRDGNPKARRVMDDAFDSAAAEWRGLGVMAGSGLAIREELAGWDAERLFEVEVEETKEAPGCACGDVLRGVTKPHECPLFRKVCTPDEPVGPCMVSSEGSCAAYFRYLARE